MENEYLCGLENFETVWKRVRGEELPPTGRQGGQEAPQMQQLAGLLDEKYAQCRLLTALAQRCPAAQSGLLRLASDEKRHFRALQLEYFLLRGACRRPTGKQMHFPGTMEGLRLAWIREQMLRAQAEKAAEACSGELHETLIRIVGEDEGHAHGLHGILHCCFFA